MAKYSWDFGVHRHQQGYFTQHVDQLYWDVQLHMVNSALATGCSNLGGRQPWLLELFTRSDQFRHTSNTMQALLSALHPLVEPTRSQTQAVV